MKNKIAIILALTFCSFESFGEIWARYDHVDMADCKIVVAVKKANPYRLDIDFFEGQIRATDEFGTSVITRSELFDNYVEAARSARTDLKKLKRLKKCK